MNSVCAHKSMCTHKVKVGKYLFSLKYFLKSSIIVKYWDKMLLVTLSSHDHHTIAVLSRVKVFSSGIFSVHLQTVEHSNSNLKLLIFCSHTTSFKI